MLRKEVRFVGRRGLIVLACGDAMKDEGACRGYIELIQASPL